MLFKEDSVARAQHQSVRENVGWFQWTHDLVEVTGTDAGKFLDYLFVNSIYKAAVGRTKYTTMLNEDGKIIDDTIVMHMGENHYWVSTLYAPQFIKWADSHRSGFDVSYRNITDDTVMFSVQGPNSAKMMNALSKSLIDDLKRFQVTDNMIGDVQVKVHRSGFTGENGFEIYCAKSDAAAVEAALREIGKSLSAVELDILEVYVRSLSMEKGFALRQDMFGLTPYECGLDWSVDLEKDFVGKDALLRAKEEGPKQLLMGLEFLAESYEDITQREIVYSRGIPCGFVRSVIYGYTVDKNIGFAVIDSAHAIVGEKVTVGSNDSPAIVTEKCFL
jgi:glycine cleavage system aminomethyltransferase T